MKVRVKFTLKYDQVLDVGEDFVNADEAREYFEEEVSKSVFGFVGSEEATLRVHAIPRSLDDKVKLMLGSLTVTEVREETE